MKSITITEYGSFSRDQAIPGYIPLPAKTFDTLENFVLTHHNDHTDAQDLMGISARKGVGHIITAKNYVGMIAMDDGTVIEILPKTTGSNIADGKQLLIEMLKTLKDFPCKTLQTANLNTEKMSIFEIFIRMFLDEVFRIVKKGLSCDYETVASNERFFKGKLQISDHIKYNYAHKERFFVSYDIFHVNRVENRLLKSTLLYLYQKSTSERNKADIKTLLCSFTEVEPSVNPDVDFTKLPSDRRVKDYETALKWCKVFLHGRTFTSFSGSEIAFALLFPMEKLFESYVAAHMARLLPKKEFILRTQDQTHHLFDTPQKAFQLRPDIVIEHIPSKSVFIMDTKWKLLTDTKFPYGIAQSDMYQMYAYQKKYGAKHITLLYPLTDHAPTETPITFHAEDGVTVKAMFVDLLDVKNSLLGVLGDMRTSKEWNVIL